ncbi:metalloprotease FTSH [Seminavis robusta]|uniref:Metalloprotease FTSH n=1 Tax=Seminavis robusta TaxID=568900 RepID=A0A9N8DFD8_9STRA|nr:metalloprotease FTSH [Seminavis robusta]|eukprot:Sro117_g057500.1 metalloprotease FTSH (786) ;mRNA; f:97093-99688
MPHAGQLRYHDFSKLRELYGNRLSHNRNTPSSNVHWFPRVSVSVRPFHSALQTSTGISTKSSSLYHAKSSSSSSSRSFFSGTPKFLVDLKLKNLETAANAAPNDATAQYAFLHELAKHYPSVVVERMTNPSFSNFAVNTPSVILLLQAAQHTESFRQIDVRALIHRLLKTQDANNSMPPQQREALQQLLQHQIQVKPSKPEQVHQLHAILSPGIMSAPAGAGGQPWHSAGGGVLRGTDPKYPLHVEMHQSTSVKAALLGLLGRVVVTLVVVSALGAMLDEKGLGKAVGMNQNSKHIQEAEQPVQVRFANVKGVTEAKQELEEIVHYLRDPSKFTRLGGKLPRGLLLTGPPGTGKTLLAKAIAGEANVPFFFSSGSQFEEVYVGLGAKRVRELFEAAKKKSPAIIFIDEIDAIGGTRRLKDQSALKMTLNELLVQLDGFDENNGIIVIGATNFVESLDAALLRPGRFDKHVTVPLPDVGGRKEILELYASKTKLDKDVDLNILARGTTGFSGADLFNLMNQAALKASVDGLNAINMHVLEFAKDKILMGAERKTAVITKETARCTAYHEAGHALVATLTEGALPIHKATIMPRGNSLGMVTQLPEGDQTSQSLKQMLATMDVMMGGRVAEEVIFGADNVTSGASSDIMQATRIARAMVTKFGFSEQVGIVYHGGATGEEHASDETRANIDAEVKKLTDAAYQRATALLTKYSKQHQLLAQTLLEYETLTGEEVRDLIKKGKKPGRPVINKAGGSRGDTSVLGKDNQSEDGKNEKGSRLPGFGQDRH